MIIDYKYPNLEQEFKFRIDNRLQFIIYAVAGFVWDNFGVHITLTELLRDEKTQRRLYPDREYIISVHEVGRGADIRTRDFTKEEIDKIVEFVNYNVYYGKEDKEVAIYHDVKGLHLHIQIGYYDKVRLLSKPINI